MKLENIISRLKVSFEVVAGSSLINDLLITDIALDSRLVKKGAVFFAIAGHSQDGSKFIENAIRSGAVVVVTNMSYQVKKNIDNCVIIKSCDQSLLLVDFLSIFYTPLPKNIYAITGTNGKTSVAEFTRQILSLLGKNSASIGTLGVVSGVDLKSDLQNSNLTTPDIVSLYKNLAVLKSSNIDDVVIEASSIGLEQGRIAGMDIAVAAFTNFSQDHLDYHKTMNEYFEHKMILFGYVLDSKGCAVLNSDIEEFKKIKEICDKRKIKIIEYGLKAKDLKILEIVQNNLGLEVFFEFRGKKYNFKLSVNGDFQALNAICALGNVLAKYDLSDIELENLLTKFPQLNPAIGRMQRVAILKNKAQVFVDFAHSPDALSNILKLARKMTKKRVSVLFGCGGNRDTKKRPIMGEIACELADLVIVTDDNPRNEDPHIIRAQIISACNMNKTFEIPNRKIAIAKAITMLQNEDILILAGKGHEKYQIIGDEKSDFDEEKIVKNVVEESSQ